MPSAPLVLARGARPGAVHAVAVYPRALRPEPGRAAPARRASPSRSSDVAVADRRARGDSRGPPARDRAASPRRLDARSGGRAHRGSCSLPRCRAAADRRLSARRTASSAPPSSPSTGCSSLAVPLIVRRRGDALAVAAVLALVAARREHRRRPPDHRADGQPRQRPRRTPDAVVPRLPRLRGAGGHGRSGSRWR